VVEINEALDASPELVNQDPYGEGWMIKVRPSNWDEERATLMDANAYAAHIGA